MQNRSEQITCKSIEIIFIRNNVFYKSKWCLENKDKLRDATDRNTLYHWIYFLKEKSKIVYPITFKKSIKT